MREFFFYRISVGIELRREIVLKGSRELKRIMGIYVYELETINLIWTFKMVEFMEKMKGFGS